MKNLLLPFIALLLLIPSLPAPAQTADTRGREFFVTFLPNFGSGTSTETSDLSIYLSSAYATIATITNNATGQQHVVDLPTPNTVVSVDLVVVFGEDLELEMGSGTRSKRSFLVEAENEITLSGVNIRIKSADAFVAYPTDVLRRHNWVVAYGNGFDAATYDQPTQFAIIGIEEETAVEIIPTVRIGEYEGGKPFTISLDRGEVFLAQGAIGSNVDLTGTEINASAPVAVFGGNRRTSIPRDLGNFRDHLVEQIPPTEAWGNDVIVAPFFPIDVRATESAVVRILSADFENSWYVDGVYQGLLERGKFIDIPLDGPMRITSAASILVTQYDHSSGPNDASGFRLGDPCMMIVPPVDNYDTLYTFQSIPHPEFVVHYINIVATDSAIATLRLDGEPVTGAFIPIPGTGFRYLQLVVPAGAHLIHASHPFGVQVYGYGEATSYAYTGGFIFRRLVTRVEVLQTQPGAALAGVFPNPAAGSWARVSLKLPRSGPLTVELINSSGETVLRPIAGEIYPEGAHEIEINLLSLPSGSYRLRVVAGEEIDSRTLLITR